MSDNRFVNIDKDLTHILYYDMDLTITKIADIFGIGRHTLSRRFKQWKRKTIPHSERMKGSKHTEETKRKIGEKRTGEYGRKNHNWKDWNKLEYGRKHIRMKRVIPKPEICPICNKNKVLELTNLDHKYSQNTYDWRWKCKGCHLKHDYKKGFRNGR